MTTTACPFRAIRSFYSKVPHADPDELRRRPAYSGWPDEPPTVGWGRGMPLSNLGELDGYPRTAADWRGHEAAMNAYPRFAAPVDGRTIRFWHVRSPEPGALPLIITYRVRPGAVGELLAIVEALADPASYGDDPADAFHVVAPTLPGDEPSEPIQDSEGEERRTARALALLMRRLGYGRYAAHAGDWSAGIARSLGVVDPDHVVGLHLTQGLGPTPPRAGADPADEGDRQRLRTESWVPAAPATTPTAVAVIGRDFLSVRHYTERRNNVMHWSALDRGGPRAASAIRDLLVADIRDFFRRLR
jgi:hypothetical protein